MYANELKAGSGKTGTPAALRGGTMQTIIISDVHSVGQSNNGEAAFIDAMDQDSGEVFRIAVHHSRMGALIEHWMVAAGEAARVRAPDMSQAKPIHLFSPTAGAVAPIEGEPAVALQFEVLNGALVSFRLNKETSHRIAQSLLKWAQTLVSSQPGTKLN